jgi:hypothetical protein
VTDEPNGNMFYLKSGTPASKTMSWKAGSTNWMPADTTYTALAIGGDDYPYFNSPQGGDTSMLGNIDEILVFNRALSSQERYTVESYLSQKFNLATSAFPTGLPNGEAPATSGSGT